MPPKSKAFFVDKEWSDCPICCGRFVIHDPPHWQLKYKQIKIPVCAWCFTRGGKFMILFIQFVEQFASRACESDGIDACGCPPCTARRILEYRDKVVGHQIAPITLQ